MFYTWLKKISFSYLRSRIEKWIKFEKVNITDDKFHIEKGYFQNEALNVIITSLSLTDHIEFDKIDVKIKDLSPEHINIPSKSDILDLLLPNRPIKTSSPNLIKLIRYLKDTVINNIHISYYNLDINIEKLVLEDYVDEYIYMDVENLTGIYENITINYNGKLHYSYKTQEVFIDDISIKIDSKNSDSKSSKKSEDFKDFKDFESYLPQLPLLPFSIICPEFQINIVDAISHNINLRVKSDHIKFQDCILSVKECCISLYEHNIKLLLSNCQYGPKIFFQIDKIKCIHNNTDIIAVIKNINSCHKEKYTIDIGSVRSNLNNFKNLQESSSSSSSSNYDLMNEDFSFLQLLPGLNVNKAIITNDDFKIVFKKIEVNTTNILANNVTIYERQSNQVILYIKEKIVFFVLYKIFSVNYLYLNYHPIISKYLDKYLNDSKDLNDFKDFKDLNNFLEPSDSKKLFESFNISEINIEVKVNNNDYLINLKDIHSFNNFYNTSIDNGKITSRKQTFCKFSQLNSGLQNIAELHIRLDHEVYLDLLTLQPSNDDIVDDYTNINISKFIDIIIPKEFDRIIQEHLDEKLCQVTKKLDPRNLLLWYRYTDKLRTLLNIVEDDYNIRNQIRHWWHEHPNDYIPIVSGDINNISYVDNYRRFRNHIDKPKLTWSISKFIITLIDITTINFDTISLFTTPKSDNYITWVNFELVTNTFNVKSCQGQVRFYTCPLEKTVSLTLSIVPKIYYHQNDSQLWEKLSEFFSSPYIRPQTKFSKIIFKNCHVEVSYRNLVNVKYLLCQQEFKSKLLPYFTLDDSDFLDNFRNYLLKNFWSILKFK